MGIDVQSLTKRRQDREVGDWVTALRERYKGMKMIVARDKIDDVQVCTNLITWLNHSRIMQGIRQKFLAFERFLEQNKQFQGNVCRFPFNLPLI